MDSAKFYGWILLWCIGGAVLVDPLVLGAVIGATVSWPALYAIRYCWLLTLLQLARIVNRNRV